MTIRKTTTPMTPESPNVERKSSWRDEHLECICEFAHGQGGVLEIGRNDCGEVVGVDDVLRLLEEIPNRVQSLLGIVVNIDLRSDCGREYLRIVVPSHPAPISYRRGFPTPCPAPGCSGTTRWVNQKTTRKCGSARKPPENLRPHRRFPAREPGGQPPRNRCGA